MKKHKECLLELVHPFTQVDDISKYELRMMDIV